MVDIPKPIIEIANDTIIGEFKSFEICITPQRNIQRMELFADTSYVFYEFIKFLNSISLKPLHPIYHPQSFYISILLHLH